MFLNVGVREKKASEEVANGVRLRGRRRRVAMEEDTFFIYDPFRDRLTKAFSISRCCRYCLSAGISKLSISKLSTHLCTHMADS
jgi:hypothetical protein